MITYPLWFKVFLGFGCFAVIIGLLKHFAKNKMVDSINLWPNEKKKKIITSYTRMILIEKIYVYSTPVIFFVLYGCYKSRPEHPETFFHIMVIEFICLILLTNDLIYKRSILKKVKET